MTLTPVIDMGGGDVRVKAFFTRVCARGCVCVRVHEGVRLIEVVRVKMIPSGGNIAGGGGGWVQQWVTERDQ